MGFDRVLAVAGVANSVNIIDGFNGLASMCVVIMLAALAYDERGAWLTDARIVAYSAAEAAAYVSPRSYLLQWGHALLGVETWNRPAKPAHLQRFNGATLF